MVYPGLYSYRLRVRVITRFRNILFFSYCFCLLSEFVKVFERKVRRVQAACFHNAARAFSSPSRCFQLSRQIFISFIFDIVQEKIIVQEKNECDSHPQKADDRWSLVENTHAANRTKIKRNQQPIPNDCNCNCTNWTLPLGLFRTNFTMFPQAIGWDRTSAYIRRLRLPLSVHYWSHPPDPYM